RDPVKEAFLRALQKTVDHFEKQYPALAVEDIFKQNAYEQQYIVFLAQFLLRDGQPDPSTLASLWADALYKSQPEKRRVSVHQLEPIAADFLEYLNRILRTEPALRDLQNSQAFERTAESVESMARDIAELRQRLESDKATPGTRRDYLHWLIERNLYLDPRGIYQT